MEHANKSIKYHKVLEEQIDSRKGKSEWNRQAF
jgi:hypothetical protein